MKISWNDRATVRLTPFGVEVLGRHYDAVGLGDLANVPAVGQPYSTELWNLAHIFGLPLRQGGKEVFETSEIELEVRP